MEASGSGDSSAMAIHSSVRLLHMLSAFRRICLSTPFVEVTMDAGLGEVPCGPVLPVIAANAKASNAVASNAR